MRTFFAPATALMNRLRYPRKFLLIGAVAAVAMLLLLFTVYTTLSQNIRAAELEISGLQLLRPINRMTQFMQQHRGLSSGVLNGNEAMKTQRADKEKEVAAAVSATDAALPETLRESPEWRAIRSAWDDIQKRGLAWTPAENLQRHSGMIRRMLAFMTNVADKTGLTQDPVESTYYLMDTSVVKLPRMLEALGVTRAQGTGVLTARELSQQRRVDISVLIARMDDTLQEQSRNLDKVVKLVPALEPRLTGPVREFGGGVEDIFRLLESDVLSGKFETPPKDYFAQVTRTIDTGYKMMFDALLPHFEEQLNVRLDDTRRIMWINVGTALVVCLLVCYLAAGAYYSVIDNIQVFSGSAHRFAEGDLTARFDTHGNDELQVAGRDFENMAASIRALVRKIQDDAAQLLDSAGQLAATSGQILVSAGSQVDMAATVREMTAGIGHVAQNAQDAQTYSRESDTIASRGVEMVQEVVTEIRGIATTVNESAQAIETLSEKSSQISTIIGTIRDIADQTNLLALNAAIEAARAGESGRGFAVVADEVRKLAERTGVATKEIAGMIDSIQAGTAHAVSSMKTGVERVTRGVEQARQAGEMITQVQSHSHMVVNAVSGISTSLDEQATVSAKIVGNVERIMKMAEENNTSARGNAGMADNLRQLAEDLSSQVARFRT